MGLQAVVGNIVHLKLSSSLFHQVTYHHACWCIGMQIERLRRYIDKSGCHIAGTLGMGVGVVTTKVKARSRMIVGGKGGHHGATA